MKIKFIICFLCMMIFVEANNKEGLPKEFQGSWEFIFSSKKLREKGSIIYLEDKLISLLPKEEIEKGLSIKQIVALYGKFFYADFIMLKKLAPNLYEFAIKDNDELFFCMLKKDKLYFSTENNSKKTSNPKNMFNLLSDEYHILILQRYNGKGKK